ncbi:MSC_0775 family lipoprotein [Mycoplasma mycoides]|uniref:MSC_0775 family lipoprotein n=1 Tax=Mycoplasma mycoides TaxID=2102 RepID=UPI0027327692|nr:lipoprotein [Mycoplasma mycoides]MDP4040350.1 lipoprotein [Mycoplasma mycoides]MDP4041216.1 lipoprotein [Mycoplasma mycoides]MDP4042109.1 lipoprotein [Mycoplasma mycoides]MDP4043511.1 lipoprotein [Mycoplasma mycoides]MDP4044379.1 lipoprotein [Mycoplasma mycoides]
MFKSKKLIIPLLTTLAVVPSLVVVSCKNPQSTQSLSEKIYLNYNLQTEKDKQEFENYNQINMLSEINQYFTKHDHNKDLVKFTTDGASGDTVEFNNIMKNNYASKYIKFDQDKFKEIIKKEFNLSDSFLNRLEFEVDYNNISRDYGNNFDIIFPIRVKLPLVSHNNFKYQQGLFIEQTFNFRIKNVKASGSEKIDTKNIKSIYEELLKLKDKNNFTASVKTVTEEIKKLVEEWGIHELNSTQLSSIFDVKTEEFDKLLSENKEKKIEFKKIITDIDLSDSSLAFDEGFVKVRLAIRDNTDEKKGQPEAGINVWVKFKFDKNNSFWKELKLSELIKVNTVKYTETNTDFTNLDKANLLIKAKSDFIKGIKVKSIDKTTDYRNSKLLLEILTNESSNNVTNLHKKLGVGKYTDLYSADFTKSNIHAPNFATERLTQENLKSINKDFFRQFDSELFSGGYAKSRGFYGEKIKSPQYMHIGEDYIANDFQAVVMPYDGEIIAAYELTTNIPFSGVGTVLVARIPVANLPWSPKEKEIYLNDNKNHIYISFLHLDAQKTLNNDKLEWSAETVNLGEKRTVKVVKSVTSKTPKKVSKGTVIGYLGDHSSNGGWMSHAHINLYTNRPNYLSENYFSSKTTRAQLDDKRAEGYKASVLNNKFSQIGNIGVEFKQDSKIYEVDPKTGTEDKMKEIKSELPQYFNNLSMLGFEKTKGYANPNLMYKLRDERTVSFSVKEVNKL